MSLRAFHQRLGAQFTNVNGIEMVASYGDVPAEYRALRENAGVLDLSARSRVCLTGADRVRFLHGQVTNDIQKLRPGDGCYAALVNAKGKLESDLNVYCLAEELLLDFEPGLTGTVSQRLEKYIVADDVQVMDVGELYGLLSVQGPKSAALVSGLKVFTEVPAKAHQFRAAKDERFGEIYLVHHSRTGSIGFDLFVPLSALEQMAHRLITEAQPLGGRAVGWEPLEIARIEAGIPRFGVDMDATNFPQEAGIETLAVSYTKGCYIGQEVLNRIHTMGHVNRQLRGLRIESHAAELPAKGDKLQMGAKEVGLITSATLSPSFGAIALAYLANTAGTPGTEVLVRSAGMELGARVTALPFVPG